MNEKPKFPREQALAVAREIYDKLLPFCERCKVVGSLRRGKRQVHDIELLFIPKLVQKQRGLFDDGEKTDVVDLNLHLWEAQGYIRRRVGKNDTTAWGLQNKLAVHVASGIPVDFFATTAEKWWNSVVVRTGGKLTNLKLTKAAKDKGLTLHAYGDGFTVLKTGEKIQTHSEEEVFKIAGVPYTRPEFRQ